MSRARTYPFGVEPVDVAPGLPRQPPEPMPRLTEPLRLDVAPPSPAFRGGSRSTMPLVSANASPWVLMPPAVRTPAAPTTRGPREERPTVDDLPMPRTRRDAWLPPRQPRVRWTPWLGAFVFFAGVCAMQLGVIAVALHVRRLPEPEAATGIAAARVLESPEGGTETARLDAAPGPSARPPTREAGRPRPASDASDVREPWGL